MENIKEQYSERLAKLSPKRLALLVMNLQAKLDESEKNRREKEPIAIVGMGCRFPMGVNTPNLFWQRLCEGYDGIKEVPPERWDIDAYFDPNADAPGKMNSRFGGFLEDIGAFDSHFFNISPREARSMDPQQRLLLEVAWEALENAAISPDQLNGSQTGVFIGICGSDYLQMVMNGDEADIDTYSATGNSHSIASGRLSYLLGLQGPAYSIDTACSSSLAAVHLACNSLLMNECRTALAGGVNLIIAPEATITLSKLRMMAPDGRCKAFDAAADGFVRGEGCGVILMKRLSHAVEDGNRIIAVIRGSAANQDGRSNGLTAPNGLAQEAVIRSALRDAGMVASDIGYVECHGTGTNLGDPIEVQALAAVLGKERSTEDPMMIGSVKSNIGHLEAAAGIAGLIKAVLCLEYRELPPSLNFNNPNPHIPWERLPLKVVTKHSAWGSKRGICAAGVSSFGFSGTNVHVIVEEAPLRQSVAAKMERPMHLLTLSAKSEEALRELARRYEQYLEANPSRPLGDVCFTANAGRAHFGNRLAIVSESNEKIQHDLAAFKGGKAVADIRVGQSKKTNPPEVVFLFTGQGSQYLGMGRDLFDTQPTFRKALRRCDEILRPYLEQPLLSVLYPESGQSSPLDRTAYTQPALFALEYALAELWRSWGIEPSAVMGHSVGEYVAACIAGVFSLEDGLKLIAARARLMQGLPAGGRMVAVMADESRVASAIAPYHKTVSLACLNGPQSMVISGASSDVEAVLKGFASEGIPFTPITVSHAFHSPLMEPILDEFERVAEEVTFAAPRISLVSNVSGAMARDEEMTDASYWRRHIREPVRFSASMIVLHDQGYRLFMELGPHPILMGMGAQCLSDSTSVWLPSLRRGQKDWQQLLTSLADLYVRGAEVDWSLFDAPYGRHLVDLPTYPFDKTQYWLNKQRSVRSEAKFSGDEKGSLIASEHPLIGQQICTARNEIVFTSSVSRKSPSFLEDHRVYGHVILPAPVFIEIVLAALNRTNWQGADQLLDMIISEALLLPEDECVELQLIFSNPSEHGATFEIFASHAGEDSKERFWRLHASGKIGRTPIAERYDSKEAISLTELKLKNTNRLGGRSYYERLEALGIQFGPSFRGILELWCGEGTALGRLGIPSDLAIDSEDYVIHPVLLDAAFQTLGAALPMGKEHPAYLMVGFEKFISHGNMGSMQWALGEIRSGIIGTSDVLVGDISLLADTGEILGQIKGIRIKLANRDVLVHSARKKFDDWLYAPVWTPVALETLPHSSSLYLMSPGQIADLLKPSLGDWNDRFGLNDYLALVDGLNVASLRFLVKALFDLGWDFSQGKKIILDEFITQLGILPKYRDLARCLLGMLREEGVVTESGETWETVSIPESVDPRVRLDALYNRFPQFEGEVTLLGQCGSKLGQVLKGQQDPLQLLFPKGSMEAVEKLTQHSPLARAYNGLVREAVEQIVACLPEKEKIRIIEIGAGTGGTTSAVLPVLPPGSTEYAFTDVAHAFLTNAKRKFNEYPFVTYSLLDIEQDPVKAGFPSQSYDLVIAANVLHATADLKASLGNIKKLLAPNGLLVLLEGTGPQSWVNLTFGLTDGWWRFGDRDLRKTHPLISAEQWLKLLADEGFVEVEAIPHITETSANLPMQTLILARGPAEAEGSVAVSPREEDASRGDEHCLWIVLSDKSGFGQKLANHIDALGDSHIMVSSGRQFRKLDDSHWEVNHFSVDDYDELFREAMQIGQYSDCRVLHLLSLDAAPGSRMTLATLESDVERNCRSILSMIQAMMKVRWTQQPKLWVVTSNVQSWEGESKDVSLSQAPVWGLGRTIAEEHPEVWGGLVDLEATGSEEEIHQLFSEMLRNTGENQIVLRSGTRYIGRLERRKLSKHPIGNISFSDEHTYLVTGGFGGMGFKLAEWLTQKGVKNLVIIGRRGAATDNASQFVERLKAQGVRVEVHSADVSKEIDMRRVLASIESSMPPLKGVFHLAGIFEDRVLIRHSWDRFERVFAPKITGAWLLHELTQHMALDFFVLFASAASFLAPVGLGNYAAANAFLDTLAHYRRNLGLPALSIDWGPWDKIGMADAVGTQRENQWSQSGFTTMTPQQGLDIMEQLLMEAEVQVGVLSADWPKYLKRFGVHNPPPFFSCLAGKEINLGSTERALKADSLSVPERLKQVHPNERRDILVDYIRDQVLLVLGFDRSHSLNPQTGFFDLGMDSLTAIELKNRLQASFKRNLPATLAFDYSNVDALANYLADDVLNCDADDKIYSHNLLFKQGLEVSPHTIIDEHQVGNGDKTVRILCEDDWEEGEL